MIDLVLFSSSWACACARSSAGDGLACFPPSKSPVRRRPRRRLELQSAARHSLHYELANRDAAPLAGLRRCWRSPALLAEPGGARHKGKRPEDHIGARPQTQGAGPGGRHRGSPPRGEFGGYWARCQGRGASPRQARGGSAAFGLAATCSPNKSESKFLRNFTGGHSRLISAA